MEISTVIVADDSDSDRHRLVTVLLDGRYNVIEAYDGQDAVQKTLSNLPDLVFMDVSMPELNGFQAARKLSKNEATQHIPIIMVGGVGKQMQERWALRQGARGYIDKPVDRKKVFTVIAGVSEEQRRTKAVNNNDAKGTLALGATDQFIAKAERQLTEYVGPLAHMLVRQAAQRARDKNEFYNLLAKQILDEEDRDAFLNLYYDEFL